MQKRNLFLIMAAVIGFCFIAASCNKEENDEMVALNSPLNNSANSSLAAGNIRWHRIEAKTFTVEVPGNWEYLQLPSLDTYNGMFTGGEDSMTYEYGIMPDTFKIDPERFSFHYEIIDGRRAKIIQGERYGIAIDEVRRSGSMQRRFIMMQSSNSPMDRDVAMHIIRSIRFD